jgi:NAD(P)-dependent dehydrogenase (short-subunit alcohol dehydrogenase family)
MSKALIWGAGGGIGRALTEELASQGWDVIGVARDTRDLGDNVWLAIEADVSNEFAVRSAVLSAGYETTDIPLWIYAAGDITSAPVSEMDNDTWLRIINANLVGAYLTTHHSLPLLAPDATLIYLGAVSERLRLPGLSAYAAAKAGLEAFAEALRKEERKRRVLVVRPGAVETALWDKVPMRLPKDAAAPQKVARRILQAYAEGTSGVLDLTHS